MNLFQKQYPNTSHKRFKQSLRTAYKILDCRPNTIRPTMNSIPLFLPSLNITFEASQKQIMKEKQKSKQNQKIQKQKFLLKKKNSKLKQLETKLNRLKSYKKDLKRWQKTKNHIDIDEDRIPFITMMTFDKNHQKYQTIIKNTKVIKTNKQTKSTITSNIKIINHKI